MPCRVSLEHAEPGEELLLLHFEHQPANTPYRAAHAIYVRRVAAQAFDAVDIVPEVLASRLPVRAFDAGHMMIDAEVCEGSRAAEMFDRYLGNPRCSYLQVHNARRGGYAARVERAPKQTTEWVTASRAVSAAGGAASLLPVSQAMSYST
jgi:Protein of unknown function (DUF1203)